MIKFRGVEIPTLLEELVNVRHTVVLVIDPQKDLTREMRPETMYPKMVSNLASLLEVARKTGLKVVHTQMFISPHTRSAANWYKTMKIRGEKDPDRIPDFVVEGTEGAEFIDAVKPKPEDFAIRKYRNSAFAGTCLDLILRNCGAKTLVVTGCQTDGCVASTVFDAAYSFDYFVVLVNDCIAATTQEIHEDMMKVMRRRFDVVDWKLLADVWSGKKKGIDLIKS